MQYLRRTFILSLMVVATLSVLYVGDANAQVVIDNLAGNSLERMRRWFDGTASPLQIAVKNTFYFLALIEISWAMTLLVIKNAGLQQFISVLVVRTMYICLLYTSPSPRDGLLSRMPSSA